MLNLLWRPTVLLICISGGLLAQSSAPCPGSLATGAAIEVRWGSSTWWPSVLVGCKGAQYQIRYTSDNSLEVVDGSRVRNINSVAPPSAATASPKKPAAVKPKTYSCSAFVGIPPNGHMQPMPAITIKSGGVYVHATGNSRGDFTYDSAQSLILFKGGNLDGQAARYDESPTGAPTLHIYNERRSRTLIDCD